MAERTICPIHRPPRLLLFQRRRGKDRLALTQTGIDTPGHVVPAKTRVPSVSGIDRPRLTSKLADIWNYPSGLVIGPAGYGKTTLLAQLAGLATADGAGVAWYQASASESAPADLLRHLHRAVRSALRPASEVTAPWDSVEEAAAELDVWADRPTLVLIDDLHVLAGTRSETALEELVAYLPPQVHLVAGSRAVPAWNMWRLRMSAMVLEITADDMRFRLWEVDRLFRNYYEEPLAPEECAELERRTEGWAGGLALFHLATRGRPPADRHRVLVKLADRPRSLRDYLAQNVLAGLPHDLHDFMVRTSVLGCLSGPICDQLLGRPGSDGVLAEIERRQLFLTSSDDGETWRFHEMLRSMLESVLVQTVGEESARAERIKAAKLLEGYGAWTDALRAYCRAEDWESVRRLLGQRGQDMVEGSLGWLDGLPADLTAQDPWVLVAVARRQLAMGAWRSAVDSYRAAEAVSPAAGFASRCQQERLALMAWLEPLNDARPSVAGEPEWAGRLRRGIRRDPLAAAGLHETPVGDPADLLTRAGLAVLGGRPDLAAPFFEAAMKDGSGIAFGLARLGRALTAWTTGQPFDQPELSIAVEFLRGLPVPSVVALGDALTRGDLRAIGAILAEAQAVWSSAGNPWFHALGCLATGVVAIVRIAADRAPVEVGPVADAETALESAAQQFQALGSEVLRSWALALRAAVRNLQTPSDSDSAHVAVAAARLAICPGAQLLAMRALERSHSASEAGPGEIMAPNGLLNLAAYLWPSATGADPPARPAPLPAAPPTKERNLDSVVEIRCFGRFSISAGDRTVDLAGLRPKPRTLLRWLCVQNGEALHRETIIATLWPDDEVVSATRKLHVAVSSLRQLLSPLEIHAGESLLIREGQSYRLAGGPLVRLDIATFTSSLAIAETERVRGQRHEAAASLERALDQYAGDLVPEEGPAEWVIEPRERLRMQAADATFKLVSLLDELDAPTDCITNRCERGLEIDRYSDSLWKRLIEHHEEQKDLAKAARVRTQYERILAELGV